MSYNDALFECLICKKKFSKNYNLKRHMVSNHKKDETQNGDDTQQKLDKTQQKLDKLDLNISNDSGNINTHECIKCHKLFSHKWCLTRHMNNCKGEKTKNECECCLKTFKHKKSLIYHYNICKVKNKEPQTTIIHNQTNNQTNNHIKTQNNIINNNITIVYKSEGTEFKTDHLTLDDLKKLLKLATPYCDSRVMTEYSKQMFKNPENMCVKKTNMRSSHSKVHKGDNEWSLELDKTLYPQLANDMAANMSEYLQTKRNKLKESVFNRLMEFVDYMADYGYINTDEIEKKKAILQEYKTFMNALKLIVYEKTQF